MAGVLARRRGAAGIVGMLLLAGALAGGGAALAQPAVLYAAVTVLGSGSCADPADACTLDTALSTVDAGGTVQLVTPGSAAHYLGNWTVSTAGTSAAQPVTIDPAPGLAATPVLDGNLSSSSGCTTPSCGGPVLTVPAGGYVNLSGLTITQGDNHPRVGGGSGGGLLNSGTVTITGSMFTGNIAPLGGGAIFNGGGGSLTVTASTFSGNNGDQGGAIGGGGTVTVTASTFTSNSSGDGGAIDNGDGGGGGAVTVTDSTFTSNSGGDDGGAIDNGDSGGGGTVTVTDSTFFGNTAADGGAIDNGDSGGGGSVTVTASTFADTSQASGTNGAEIDNGDNSGTGSVQVAADVFAGSCDQPGGSWADGGYNAGTDTSCFAATPATGDTSDPTVGSDLQSAPASNGGPTQTIEPTAGNPAIGLIPDPASVTLGGGNTALCPATDQRGYASAPGPCDAGAVQTTGSASLTLADTSPTGGYRQAGDVINYDYQVTNTGTTALVGLTINDPAVPGASCPQSTLAPGSTETCTGSYTVTAADVTAGKVTDTATATATTTVGGTVTSNSSSVTARVAWPAIVSGTYHPPAGAAQGYYLGVRGSTWTLAVTHPSHQKVAFTGTITINAGKFTSVTPIRLERTDSFHAANRKLTFSFADYGDIDGIRFVTTTPARSITFTLKVNGNPATASDIYLGSTPTQASTGSPLTFTR